MNIFFKLCYKWMNITQFPNPRKRDAYFKSISEALFLLITECHLELLC